VQNAFKKWTGLGMAFLHIHRSEDSKYRVYIPADLRRVGGIASLLWGKTPDLTGFKLAGYDDADNRSDVIVAWVKTMAGVRFIAANTPTSWLHGMRPPGSSIIERGCLIGYSDEVAGSSVGTEVKEDLRTGTLKP
jgi:hypothetical protein